MSGQNLNKGRFSTKKSNCPLCNFQDIEFLYKITSYDQHFNVDICQNCGFIFMNPQLNKNVLSNMYGKKYFTGDAEYSYHDERNSKKYSSYVWNKRINHIKKFIPCGHFLDVGSSFGGFLRSAAKDYTPYGIEISDYAANYSKKELGKNIHAGTLDSHPFKHNFFSVITMIELIEHLPDPVYAIEECFRLLSKKGLLVIQTANMNGMQAKILKDRYAYYMPGHLSYFSMSNLIMLLKKCGFIKIKIYYPVEFGLIPKLKKSRQNFNSILDYRKWLRISIYHFMSKFHAGKFAITSSMVIYAFK